MQMKCDRGADISGFAEKPSECNTYSGPDIKQTAFEFMRLGCVGIKPCGVITVDRPCPVCFLKNSSVVIIRAEIL